LEKEMTNALYWVINSLGFIGAGAFLLHLRQVWGAFPVPLSLVCLGIGMLLIGVSLSLALQAKKGVLSRQSTPFVVIVCIAVAVASGVLGSLLQMGIALAIASSLPVDQLEYQRMGTLSTLLLVPSFFVVFVGVVCFGAGRIGLYRRSIVMLTGVLIFSVPITWLLVKLAFVPI
jgi:hypothetical protein